MNRLFLIFATLGIVSISYAQDWGPAQAININAPDSPFGNFSPSYCDRDSTLYFSTNSFPGIFHSDAKIYTSHLSRDQNGQVFWSDPVAMPAPINIDEYGSAMPFITAGGDSLFFSAIRPGTEGFADIWLTIQIDGNWTEPANLGDSINSRYLSDLKPCFVSGANALYFSRFGIANYEGIYKSELIDGVWQSAQRLPDIINTPGYYTYAPFFDPLENVLYYTDSDPYGRIQLMMKSANVNGSWQEPEPLDENINGFSCIDPDSLSYCTNENAFMSYDRTKFFFNKFILCEYPDHYSFMYFSERAVGIEGDLDQPKNFSAIESYPNPFNSQATIKFNLSASDAVKIDIYDLLGRKVETLVDRNLSAGNHSITWDAGNVATGIYFARLQTTNKFESIKLTLLK